MHLLNSISPFPFCLNPPPIRLPSHPRGHGIPGKPTVSASSPSPSPIRNLHQAAGHLLAVPHPFKRPSLSSPSLSSQSTSLSSPLSSSFSSSLSTSLQRAYASPSSSSSLSLPSLALLPSSASSSRLSLRLSKATLQHNNKLRPGNSILRYNPRETGHSLLTRPQASSKQQEQQPSASQPSSQNASAEVLLAGMEAIMLDTMATLSTAFQLQEIPVEEKLRRLSAGDAASGREESFAYGKLLSSSRLRIIRPAIINSSNRILVLNLIVCPRPEYSLPVYGVDIVALPRGSVVTIDLQPLGAVYEDLPAGFVERLEALHARYQLNLPGGGDIPTEAAEFFSPYGIWARPSLTADVLKELRQAAADYLEVYVDLVNAATREEDQAKVEANRLAQHKYLVYRAVKDPGRSVLARTFGADITEDFINDFLFDGVKTLEPTRTFADYFPSP